MTAIPLSCGDHSFPLLPQDHTFRLIQMLGVEGVDLALFGGGPHLQPERVREDPRTWAVDVGRSLGELGLHVSDVFLIPSSDFAELAPNSPEPDTRSEARALFADIAEFAARVGSPGITVVPGVEWPSESARDSLARAAEELAWRAELAKSLGLRFSIEAHVGSVCPTPELALELLAAAPGVELTLDYTHFVAQGIGVDRIVPLHPHARHFHARGGRRDRVQCSLSQSEIDYEPVMKALNAAAYDGFVALEVIWAEWQGMNDCDVISESVMLRDLLREQLSP